MKRNFRMAFMIAITATILSSCSSCCNSGRSAALEETALWKLETLNGKMDSAFAEKDYFTVSFIAKDSSIAGVGACNRFFGKYNIQKKNGIDISMGGATMMACPNMELEQPFFAMLDEADKYKIEDKKLLLYKADELVAVFIPFQPVIDMHNAETSLDFIGEYTGTFPAADCPGINITLVLGSDSIFTLDMDYIDRETKFVKKGTFTIEENLITLNSDQDVEYYKVGENTLTKLNNEKEAVTGELASSYVLLKK